MSRSDGLTDGNSGSCSLLYVENSVKLCEWIDSGKGDLQLKACLEHMSHLYFIKIHSLGSCYR